MMEEPTGRLVRKLDRAALVIVLNKWKKHICAAIPEMEASITGTRWEIGKKGIGPTIAELKFVKAMGQVSSLSMPLTGSKTTMGSYRIGIQQGIGINTAVAHFDRQLQLEPGPDGPDFDLAAAIELRKILESLDLIPDSKIMGRDEWIDTYGLKPQCYLCGNPMEIRGSKTGTKFWGCSTWRHTGCKGTIHAIQTVDDEGDDLPAGEWILPPRCDRCSAPMRSRDGARGKFWGCTQWREGECDRTIDGPHGMGLLTKVHDWMPSKKAAAARKKAVELIERAKEEAANRAITDALALSGALAKSTEAAEAYTKGALAETGEESLDARLNELLDELGAVDGGPGPKSKKAMTRRSPPIPTPPKPAKKAKKPEPLDDETTLDALRARFIIEDEA
jgi:ssDNA-binding Zn-finger/Zn-ribbon topoisomerase 1